MPGLPEVRKTIWSLRSGQGPINSDMTDKIYRSWIFLKLEMACKDGLHKMSKLDIILLHQICIQDFLI